MDYNESTISVVVLQSVASTSLYLKLIFELTLPIVPSVEGFKSDYCQLNEIESIYSFDILVTFKKSNGKK